MRYPTMKARELFSHAQTLLSSNQIKEATPYLQEAIRQEPLNPDYHEALAQVYKTGKEAKLLFENVLLLDPTRLYLIPRIEQLSKDIVVSFHEYDKDMKKEASIKLHEHFSIMKQIKGMNTSKRKKYLAGEAANYRYLLDDNKLKVYRQQYFDACNELCEPLYEYDHYSREEFIKQIERTDHSGMTHQEVMGPPLELQAKDYSLMLKLAMAHKHINQIQKAKMYFQRGFAVLMKDNKFKDRLPGKFGSDDSASWKADIAVKSFYEYGLILLAEGNTKDALAYFQRAVDYNLQYAKDVISVLPILKIKEIKQKYAADNEKRQAAERKIQADRAAAAARQAALEKQKAAERAALAAREKAAETQRAIAQSKEEEKQQALNTQRQELQKQNDMAIKQIKLGEEKRAAALLPEIYKAYAAKDHLQFTELTQNIFNQALCVPEAYLLAELMFIQNNKLNLHTGKLHDFIAYSKPFQQDVANLQDAINAFLSAYKFWVQSVGSNLPEQILNVAKNKFGKPGILNSEKEKKLLVELNRILKRHAALDSVALEQYETLIDNLAQVVATFMSAVKVINSGRQTKLHLTLKKNAIANSQVLQNKIDASLRDAFSKPFEYTQALSKLLPSDLLNALNQVKFITKQIDSKLAQLIATLQANRVAQNVQPAPAPQVANNVPRYVSASSVPAPVRANKPVSQPTPSVSSSSAKPIDDNHTIRTKLKFIENLPRASSQNLKRIDDEFKSMEAMAKRLKNIEFFLTYGHFHLNNISPNALTKVKEMFCQKANAAYLQALEFDLFREETIAALNNLEAVVKKIHAQDQPKSVTTAPAIPARPNVSVSSPSLPANILYSPVKSDAAQLQISLSQLRNAKMSTLEQMKSISSAYQRLAPTAEKLKSAEFYSQRGNFYFKSTANLSTQSQQMSVLGSAAQDFQLALQYGSTDSSDKDKLKTIQNLISSQYAYLPTIFAKNSNQDGGNSLAAASSSPSRFN